MPEGHTIHRLARDLERDFRGKSVRATSPQGRFAEEAALLDERIFESARALGKHLLLHIGGTTVHVHLGLFGKMKRARATEKAPRPSVRLRLATETWIWDLAGPTICEIADEATLARLRARIGVDLLGTETASKKIWDKVHRSRRTIGALLLDQSVFAGIGNVYRAELLFLTHLHPETRGEELTRAQVTQMVRLGRRLLVRGVEANRIVTVANATAKTKRADALYVYKRSVCRVCAGAIRAMKSANRTLYYCPTCQPAEASAKDETRRRRGAISD